MKTSILKSISSIYLITLGLCISWTEIQAAVSSPSGNLFFDANSDGINELTLNSTGLGVGKTPSTNLDVSGNALISGDLFIGTTTGSSNLNLSGTLGFGMSTYTSNSNIGNASMVLADPVSSGGNLQLVLPYAGNVEGRIVDIKQISTGNSLTIYAQGSTIDNAPSIETTGTAYSHAKVISSANNWHILSSTDFSSGNLMDIPGLVLWYDADDLDGDFVSEGASESGYTAGPGNISQWSDKSGNNYHLTTSAGNSEPGYMMNTLNGKQVVTFAGNILGNLGAGPDLKQGDMFTLFYRETSGGSNDHYVFLFTNDRPRLYTDIGVANELYRGVEQTQDFSKTDTELNGVSSLNADRGSWYLMYGSAYTSWTSRSYDLRVGGRSKDGVGARFLYGKIAEILFFDRVLDITYRRQVEAYLKTKWGLNTLID
jgi:hypothetical protein